MGRSVEESDPRLCRRFEVINAVVDHGPIAIVTCFQRAYEFDLFAAVSRNAPQSGNRQTFRVVKESTVRRFERCKSTVACHLHGGTPPPRRTPKFPNASAVCRAIPRPPISRPTS